MKARLISGILVLTGIVLLSSCGKDPEPNAGVSFDVTEDATTESDGTIKSFHPLLWKSYASNTGATGTATGREYKVKLLLDRPAAETSVISYTITGTAIKNSASAIGDFSVEGTNLTIDKGASEAYITLTLFEDFEFFELDNSDDLFKTIIITLNSVVSGPASISETNNIYTLTINEDDLLSVLQWNINPTTGAALTTALDVDMDLLLWAGSTQTGLGSVAGATAGEYSNKIGTEYTSIPGGFPNATYGLSYIYYSGTANPLSFMSWFVGTIGSTTYTLDKPLTYTKNYTTANINKYDDATVGKTPIIEQTVIKSGLTFSNVSAITVPPAYSRTSGSGMPLLKKSDLKNLRIIGLPKTL
jgi:hypothetical protein